MTDPSPPVPMIAVLMTRTRLSSRLLGWPVSGRPVPFWVRGLSDFDDVSVGIADVAADLVLVLFGRRHEFSATGAPFGVHGRDVFDLEPVSCRTRIPSPSTARVKNPVRVASASGWVEVAESPVFSGSERQYQHRNNQQSARLHRSTNGVGATIASAGPRVPDGGCFGDVSCAGPPEFADDLDNRIRLAGAARVPAPMGDGRAGAEPQSAPGRRGLVRGVSPCLSRVSGRRPGRGLPRSRPPARRQLPCTRSADLGSCVRGGCHRRAHRVPREDGRA